MDFNKCSKFQREFEIIVGITKRFMDIVKSASIEHTVSKWAKNLALFFEKQDRDFHTILNFFNKKMCYPERYLK